MLGVKIRIRKIFSPEDKTYMIVCNHLSYVDVLIIASIFSASFITSVEISKDIFLGSLAKLGGSIFVERRKKTRLIKDLGSVSKVLSDGLNVVLFPEGTSTNGEAILPFKKTLFRAAIQCGVEILPVCINYISIDGVTLNKKNRDLIYWYGDMKFFPHFINLLRIKQINVQLSILPAITTTKMTSDKVSKVAYESIKKVYQASW